jgi:hypothetical protein
MSGKGSISRMSDECLMKQEFGFPFYIVYQAVMRKFTLARKTFAVQPGFEPIITRWVLPAGDKLLLSNRDSNLL